LVLSGSCQGIDGGMNLAYCQQPNKGRIQSAGPQILRT